MLVTFVISKMFFRIQNLKFKLVTNFVQNICPIEMKLELVLLASDIFWVLTIKIHSQEFQNKIWTTVKQYLRSGIGGLYLFS